MRQSHYLHNLIDPLDSYYAQKDEQIKFDARIRSSCGNTFLTYKIGFKEFWIWKKCGNWGLVSSEFLAICTLIIVSKENLEK